MDEQYMNNMKNRTVLDAGETILWQGGPKKSAYLFNTVLSTLPTAILVLVFGLILNSSTANSIMDGPARTFLVIFTILFLSPVWMTIINAILAIPRCKNLRYYVTNRRIIIKYNFLVNHETTLFYKDIQNVNVTTSLTDRLFNTGTIYFEPSHVNYSTVRRKGSSYRVRNTPQYAFSLLEDAEPIYNRIQSIVMNIQTDMEFPNAMRPEENPGYNTEYTG